MAPKKKPNKPFNNHQTSDPGLVSKINLNNEATDSTSKNHKLNGHILNDKQMVGDESVLLNGCNGTHLSDSSESSCSNIHTSSPQECTNLESSSSAEVIGACLNRLTIGSGSSALPCEKSGEQLAQDPLTSPLVRNVTYVQYQSELQMPDIMRLIQKDLSEPYSIYTYRYFIHNWPMLCYLVSNPR